MEHDFLSERDSPSARPRQSNPEAKNVGDSSKEERSRASHRKLPTSEPRSSVPDGLDHVRYRPPDISSFTFDETTGYRFDPSTGLHYDANSGFFINYKSGILLRWDRESNTYVRAGDFPGLIKPLAMKCTVKEGTALLGSKPKASGQSVASERSSRSGRKSKLEHGTRNKASTHRSSRDSRKETDYESGRSSKSRRSPVHYEKSRIRSRQSGRSRSRSQRRRPTHEAHRGGSSSRGDITVDIERPREASHLPSTKRRKLGPSRSSDMHGEHGAAEYVVIDRCENSDVEDRGESKRRSSLEEIPEFVVIDSCGSSDDDQGGPSHPPSPVDGSARGVTPVPGVDSPLSRDYMSKEIPDFVVIDECKDSDCEPSEKSPEDDLGNESDAESDSRLVDDILADILDINRGEWRADNPNANDEPTQSVEQEISHPSPSSTTRNEAPEFGDSASKETPKPVVECIDVSDDEATTPKPVIDHGDVLGYLFAKESQAVTNILLIAPVPLLDCSKSESDALRSQLGDPEDILKFYVSHESSSGFPYHFIVVTFKSANAASKWYGSLNGTIELRSGGSILKGYLHFLKKGNWNCKHCKGFNFFVLSICPKCYRAKDDGFSPVSISEEPTCHVGLAKFTGGLPAAEAVVATLPPAAFDILKTTVIRERSGLSLGLCVFEVRTAEEGTKLLEFFHLQKKRAIYVKMHKKPKTEDELYLDRLFGEAPPTKILHVALIPLSSIPDKVLELSLMEIYLLMLLKEDEVSYDKITTHIDSSAGAPYSYALITFNDVKTAKAWLDSREYTFINFTAANQRSSVSLHFSEDNWKCQGCQSLNFFLRALCHRCFKRPEASLFGPISESLTPTRWVAVSGMSLWSRKDEDIISSFMGHLKQLGVKNAEVIRNAKCPLLPLACIFEMNDKVESLRLKQCLAKEGKCPAFVVVHKELNERPTEDPSSEDVMIVNEPKVECVDLTEIEDDVLIQPAEIPGPSLVPNPKALAAIKKLPPLMSLPVAKPPGLSQAQTAAPSSLLRTPVEYQIPLPVRKNPPAGAEPIRNLSILPTDEQPPPLRLSYKVPFDHPRDIITVSPVPYPGPDASLFYQELFSWAGAACDYVRFCNQDAFGVSYNYCILKFQTSEKAERWFDRKKGLLEIEYRSFPSVRAERFEPTDAYFHFIGGNWHCGCGAENAPARSICYRCYTQRGEAEPPFENSQSATRYLGIKLYKWYSVQDLAQSFPRTEAVKHFQVMKVMYIGDPMIHKDHGFYVFETHNAQAATRLREHFTASGVVKSTGFVLLKDANAGAIIELDVNFSPMVSLRIVNNNSEFNTVSGNLMEKPFVIGNIRKAVCPDYDTFVWLSLFDSCLDNPPTNIVMMAPCPGDGELHPKVRAQIMKSFEVAGFIPESVIYCDKREHGSPFSYCLVVFATAMAAQRWIDTCDGIMEFSVPVPRDKDVVMNFRNCFSWESSSEESPYFIESKLHFSQANWLCSSGHSNFCLRSLCHNCSQSKNFSPRPFVISPDPTAHVGVKLTKYYPNLDATMFYRLRDLGFGMTNVKLCLDTSFPNDPCGFIIFRTPSLISANKLFTFLTDSIWSRNESEGARDLMTVLEGSDENRITYIHWRSTPSSNWSRFDARNWDRYFSDEVVTSNVVVYHKQIVHGNHPLYEQNGIPLGPFGGNARNHKRIGGFESSFSMVSFPSPKDAKTWFARSCGVFKWRSESANLFFSPDMWKCAVCKAENFPARVICFKCHAHKTGKRFLIKLSASPTRWVGISTSERTEEHLLTQKVKAFEVLSTFDSVFKFRSVRIIIDPIVREDGPSVLVFEVPSTAIGVELQEFLTKRQITAEFFVLSV